MSVAPRTAAGKALLARESLNSRSFPLITLDAILAIEAEAASPATGEGLRFCDAPYPVEAGDGFWRCALPPHKGIYGPHSWVRHDVFERLAATTLDLHPEEEKP